MYDRNRYFLVKVRYRNWNPKWWCFWANIASRTETTFQRENLVTNSMEHSAFFPSYWNQICWQILQFFRLFLKTCVQFQALQKYIPLRSGKAWEKFEMFWKKKLVLEKIFGSNNDNEIGPCFQSYNRRGADCAHPVGLSPLIFGPFRCAWRPDKTCFHGKCFHLIYARHYIVFSQETFFTRTFH